MKLYQLPIELSSENIRRFYVFYNQIIVHGYISNFLHHPINTSIQSVSNWLQFPKKDNNLKLLVQHDKAITYTMKNNMFYLIHAVISQENLPLSLI